MKRSRALFLGIFCDLLAVAIFYFISYQSIKNVLMAVNARADVIEYNTTFFIGFCFVVIPTLHVIGFIETFLPQYFNRSIFNKVMWCSLIIPLIIGLGAAYWLKQEIVQNGYFRCHVADTDFKLAHFKVYVRDLYTCDKFSAKDKSDHDQKVTGKMDAPIDEYAQKFLESIQEMYESLKHAPHELE